MSLSLAPICFDCERLYPVVPMKGWACQAYPTGIPLEILVKAKDHRFPLPGDNGLHFKPKEGV